MDENFKYHPLGYRCFTFDMNNDFPDTSQEFRIRTCGRFKWCMELFIEGEEMNESYCFKLLSDSEFLPVQTIDLNFRIEAINKKRPEKKIVFTGSKLFSQDQLCVQVEVANRIQIFEYKRELSSDDDIIFHVFISVKEVRMIDCLELIDFYTENDSINDVKVVTGGVDLYLLKSILCLQSTYFTEIFDEKQEVVLDADEFSFENIFDFFQIAHGVDLFIDEYNVDEILKIAEKFKTPRITEKCKNFLIDEPFNMEKELEIVDRNEFWDVVPTILGKAKSVHEIREMNWNLGNLPDDTIKLLAKRVFELSRE